MSKRTKGLLMLVMLIISVLIGSSGCVNAETKDMTPEQKAYYLEDKRIKAREEFVAFIINCHYKGHILVYQGFASAISGIAEVRRDGTVYIPKHHRRYDYQCGTSAQVRQALKDAGIFGNSRGQGRH